MNKPNLQLSKWWKTASARAAFKRVEIAKRAKIEEMKKRFAARKEQLKREAEEWVVVE